MRWSPIRTGMGFAPPSPASYEACNRSSGRDLLDAGGGAALVDQVEDRLLELWVVDRELAAGGVRGLLQRRADDETSLIGVEDARVDVGGLADRRGVAEVVRDLLHGAGDGALAARLRPGHLAGHREADGREDGGVPRPEVLRGVALAGDLLDVLVDVARADV